MNWLKNNGIILFSFLFIMVIYVPFFMNTENMKMYDGVKKIYLRENEQKMAKRLNASYEPIYSVTFMSIPMYHRMRFEHGQYSFILPENSKILATSQEKLGFGVTKLDIDAPFYRSFDRNVHEVAKNKFYQFIHDLQKLGWKEYYHWDSPRLIGTQQVWEREMKDSYGVYYSQIAYQPTLKEWESVFKDDVATLSYVLYADDIILFINIKGEQRKFWEGEAIYTINLVFQAMEQEIYRDACAYDEKNKKYAEAALWLPSVEEYYIQTQQSRIETERKLKKQGFLIDENYKDPLPKIYLDYIRSK